MLDMKYWAWTEVDKKAPTEELKRKYGKLIARGLNGVFLGGGIDDREFEIVRASGLELHAWMWTLNRNDRWIREHHPEWYMVSRSGKSSLDHPPYVDYYRWLSPVIPGVQEFLKQKVDELATHPAVSGVHLDYIRYPDVILPPGLWKRYGLDQTKELPDYDFCYGEQSRGAFGKLTGRDPIEIDDPSSDQQWKRFRYDSVTYLVQQLAKVVRRHGKKITAAVFPTPRLARKICRQDWDRWPLDAACPMLYHGFYNETLNWIGECVKEDVGLVTYPIYAGLYLPDFHKPGELVKAIQICKANGASGISLFGTMEDRFWPPFVKATKS